MSYHDYYVMTVLDRERRAAVERAAAHSAPMLPAERRRLRLPNAARLAVGRPFTRRRVR